MLKRKLFFPPLILLPILLAAGLAFAEGSSACGDKCHIIKPYTEGVKDSKLLVSKHFEAGIGCTECHEYSDETRKNEEEMYKNGEYEEPMYTREYEPDFCFRCHESYQAIRKRTEGFMEKWGRNPHESHMGEIGCYECHKVHQASVFVCAECHHAKWEERLPAGWKIK
jgi:hypothetical protein